MEEFVGFGRCCWLRDATFTLSAMLNAGCDDEAVQWRSWMPRAEQIVPWLPRFDGAGPVRVGNDAAAREQIDVVGELLDALNLMARAGIGDTAEGLTAERDLINHLERTWQDKGHGMWEGRDRLERYAYSKVMSWVGVNCLVRGASRQASALKERQQ